jgi:hypothetical protein
MEGVASSYTYAPDCMSPAVAVIINSTSSIVSGRAERRVGVTESVAAARVDDARAFLYTVLPAHNESGWSSAHLDTRSVDSGRQPYLGRTLCDSALTPPSDLFPRGSKSRSAQAELRCGR